MTLKITKFIQCNNCEELQTEYDHHQNKVISLETKEADKLQSQNDSTFITSAFDLQKVLSIPSGDASMFYYKRKLSMYNFTVFDMGHNVGHCYMWYETLGGRGANEICTCVYNYISKLTTQSAAKNFVFYSDNCGGQNRNH